MRRFLFAVLVVCVFASPAVAATPDTTVTAPIYRFIVTFNKGDAKGAAATMASSVAIVDDLPPHLWTGSGAFTAWSTALVAFDKAAGISSEHVTLGEPTRVIANAERGYVVVPALYTFTQRGAAMREPAQMTFALQKHAGTWLIAGWTWVGTTPRPAGKAAR